MNTWSGAQDKTWTAQYNGSRYGVSYLYAYNYNGPDWIVPLRKQVAEFDTLVEAQQAADQAEAAEEGTA